MLIIHEVTFTHLAKDHISVHKRKGPKLIATRKKKQIHGLIMNVIRGLCNPLGISLQQEWVFLGNR